MKQNTRKLQILLHVFNSFIIKCQENLFKGRNWTMKTGAWIPGHFSGRHLFLLYSHHGLVEIFINHAAREHKPLVSIDKSVFFLAGFLMQSWESCDWTLAASFLVEARMGHLSCVSELQTVVDGRTRSHTEDALQDAAGQDLSKTSSLFLNC